MRLFVALAPPAEILEELKAVQKKLMATHTPPTPEAQAGWDKNAGVLLARRSPWRASGADQLHLTLQFLGDAHTVHAKEEIRKKLEEVGARHGEITIKPAQLGAFPNVLHASVLWAGVEGEGLAPLAKDIENTLRELGIARDKAFTPHITLCRSKIPQDAGAMLKLYEGHVWSAKKWKAEEFVLFESHPVLGGREHVMVAKYKLGHKA